METERIISDTAARCAGSPIAVYGGEQFFASLSRAAEGTGIALSRGEGCAAIVEEGEECPPELPCIVVPPRERACSKICSSPSPSPPSMWSSPGGCARCLPTIRR